MRIIGYINHPILKITIFQMENKFSVKLESGLIEQTYKFRTGEGINGLEDIRRLVDEEFLEAVMEEMGRMRSIQRHALERSLPDGQEDEFEEII